jgi:rhodanese-related sulfurtransferase
MDQLDRKQCFCSHRVFGALEYTQCLVAFLLASAVSGCVQSKVESTPVTYVTEYGLGPDKWATAWLLTRQADPGSNLVVTDAGAHLPSGVSFDSTSSAIRRLGNRSAFEVAKSKFALSDPDLNQLAEIVHEIEINAWAAGGPPEAAIVENAFRALQYLHGRDAVTPQCYVAFFDRVYQLVRDARLKSVPFTAEQLSFGCAELAHLAERDHGLIPETPIVDVLSAAAAGRKVVFVDVREVDEFSEGHIPGALNIPIREISPQLRERLQGADYVVSYCVKDFRGYEMAKALARIGVKNSVIMRPYGIKGWVALGLPVTGTKALNESQAKFAFEACLSDTAACLASARSAT